MPFLETSAKATLNVEEAFLKMTSEIYTQVAAYQMYGKPSKTFPKILQQPPPKSSNNLAKQAPNPHNLIKIQDLFHKKTVVLFPWLLNSVLS